MCNCDHSSLMERDHNNGRACEIHENHGKREGREMRAKCVTNYINNSSTVGEATGRTSGKVDTIMRVVCL